LFSYFLFLLWLETFLQPIFILLDLLKHIFADLNLLLEIDKSTSFIQKYFKSHFESFVVIRSRGDVYFVVWKDGILSIHKLIKEHTERVCVVVGIMTGWVLFKLGVVEVWDI
jgi:hypothetical protein